MPCDANTLRAALFEQAKEVREFVDEKMAMGDSIAMRLVSDKGVVEPHENQDVVIFGTARQAGIGYKTENPAPRPLVEGTMTARDLNNQSKEFVTDINSIDDNACHGMCIIDFAHGYRRVGTTDRKLKVGTKPICTEELDRMDRPQVRGFFRSLKQNFTRWGVDNFDEELFNLTIQYGEANTSILAANQFSLTTGGFQAPPAGRLSIWHLQQWKRQIRFAMRSIGRNVAPDWLFEIEAPVEDWIDAVAADQIARNPTGTRYEIKYLTDAEGPMRGRKYDVYGGIKCYFNEFPVRGVFKQTGVSGGQPTYSFVRIYDWKNVEGEIGGLVMEANPDYDEDRITIDGIAYDVVTLIPHIDPSSFQRYGLVKPEKPIGGANAGYNFEVIVRDASFIDCNDFNDKFKMVARHRFRFRAKYPQISGWMAYQHGRRAGYLNTKTPMNLVAGTTRFAGPEQRGACNPDPCSALTCASCGQVPDNNLACVDPDTAPAGTLNLAPCGAVAVSHFGVAKTVTFKVNRTGDPSSAASVAYATANGTATAGTNYTATSGTLEWDPGDTQPKEITVPILGVGAGTFTLTLSGASGDSLGTCTVATVTITNAS